VCGALVVSALALAGCGGDDEGGDSAAPVPPDAIAMVEGVEDGAVTQGELDQAIAASAELSGEEAPAPASPEYPLAAGQALDALILERWIAGEAAARGVSPDTLRDADVEELRATWEARTECATDLPSRLCPGGDEAPPDLPPASG
jgi:DNA-binding transcriptional regulator YdaS (Cro superfamily)